MRYVWIYLAIVFALSWTLQAVMIGRGGMSAFGVAGPLVLMWIPGVVALGMKAVLRDRVFALGWRLPRRAVWWIVPYALPPAVALVAYGVAWVSGLAPLVLPS